MNGTHLADWPNIVELAKRYPQFIPALGSTLKSKTMSQTGGNTYRPSESGELYDRRDRPRCFPKFRSSLPKQIELFSAQWQRAQSQQQIAIIHCVRALGPLLKVITSTPAQRPFLMHAYSGPIDLVTQLIDMSHFSFNMQQLQPVPAHTRRHLSNSHRSHLSGKRSGCDGMHSC